MKSSKQRSILFLLVALFLSNQTFSQKAISGIVTDEFKTNSGTIKITRTEHLPKGKTIKGTVSAEPDSDKEKKREKQKQELATLILKIGENLISSNGTFSVLLPETDQIPMQIFDEGGNLLEEIPLQLSEPASDIVMDLPKTLRLDNVERITGDFQGEIMEPEFLLNNKPVDIIAANEQDYFFKPGDLQPGKNTLRIKNQDVDIEQEVNVIDYSLRAEKLNLIRGESTYLEINVEGLEDLQESLRLEVINQSAGTVTLEGGDIQLIDIFPEEVAETGIWNKRFNIQSLTSGGFSIYTDLQVPEKEEPVEKDATEYIDEVVSTGEKTGTIGQMKLVNSTDELVNAVLNPGIIPGTDNAQGFTVPDKKEILLQPNSEEIIDLKGFCNDMELPVPEKGSELVSADKWFQVEEPGNVERIQELMGQELIQNHMLESLKTPVNIPGTDLSVSHAFNENADPELFNRLLLLGLDKIIDAYEALLEQGELEPGFNEKDKENTIQAAFWGYSEKLKGKGVFQQDVIDKLEPQIPENLWRNIELIGEKAKIIPESNYNSDEITFTVEENLTLAFIESTYAKFDVEGTTFSENNHLLNFENEKVLLLLMPENTDPIWYQLDTSEKGWKPLPEDEIQAMGTEMMEYCSLFSPPCPPGCKGDNPMYGTGLVIPDDRCIPSGILR